MPELAPARTVHCLSSSITYNAVIELSKNPRRPHHIGLPFSRPRNQKRSQNKVNGFIAENAGEPRRDLLHRHIKIVDVPMPGKTPSLLSQKIVLYQSMFPKRKRSIHHFLYDFTFVRRFRLQTHFLCKTDSTSINHPTTRPHINPYQSHHENETRSIARLSFGIRRTESCARKRYRGRCRSSRGHNREGSRRCH